MSNHSYKATLLKRVHGREFSISHKDKWQITKDKNTTRQPTKRESTNISSHLFVAAIHSFTMSDPQNPNPQNLPSSSASSLSNKNPTEIQPGNGNYSGQKVHFSNPPETTNPDPATLREQWRFAIRQYSKWYSHAWGTAILAGVSFFALGWIIKGSNPLPSSRTDDSSSSPSNDAKEKATR